MSGDARVLLAFTTGMLATVNPCALPMLPAYLGWFISGDDSPRRPAAAVTRAVVVALWVSLGFIVVFGFLGMVASAASAEVERITPWLTPVVGVVLALIGVSLLLGRSISLSLPRLSAGGKGRGALSMLGYGASYAVVSVSCTLPVFLIHVGTTFGEGWSTGVVQLLGFAAGFTLVLVALSVSVALAHGSLTSFARQVTPYVSRIAGGLLVLTGIYLVWYGIAEIRLRTSRPDDPIIDRVTGWSADISAAVHNFGATEVGLALAMFIAAVTAVLLIRSNRSSRPS